MCIACRNRESQHSLIRIQFIKNRAVAYTGSGRSYYVCQECGRTPKRIKKIIKQFKLDEEDFLKLIKELDTDG
ncbi:DUF448 domain-containing protein [Nitratifractor sp.]